MMQIALIGIGAGVAAAVLFASLTTGSLLSIVLFYLSPLPMMIAALGWSHWSALIGAFTAALALTAVFGSVFFSGIPRQRRPAGLVARLSGHAGAPGARRRQRRRAPLEWYPPGRLVMWAALAAMAMIAAAILYAGPDAESFPAHMHRLLAELLRVESGDAPASR